MLGILLVLDNTEDILNSDGDNFKIEIGLLLENCKFLKILLTSWESIDKINQINDFLLDLDLFSPEETERMINIFYKNKNSSEIPLKEK